MTLCLFFRDIAIAYLTTIHKNNLFVHNKTPKGSKVTKGYQTRAKVKWSTLISMITNSQN